MKKSYFWFIVFALSSVTFLSGCFRSEEGNGSLDGTSNTNPQKESTLIYGIDSQFKGVLNWNFYDSVSDEEILSFLDDPLIDYDENLKPIPNITSWQTEDHKIYTFTFEKGVKWHNGTELTVHDWVFAIETIAKLGEGHQRWANVKTVKGTQEFSEGEADSISGLEVIDDHTLKVTFDKARVYNLETLWMHPLSKKEFEGIPPEEMAVSDQVLLQPIGTGPFKVHKITPGKSVELIRNEAYWKGKPRIEKVLIKVIDSSLLKNELETGKIDLAEVHPALIPEIKALSNISIVTYPGLSYYYVGFKLGKLEGHKNVVNLEKYQNQSLRQAMLYAINREEWVQLYFNGAGKPLNRPVPTAIWMAADNETLPVQYVYDPQKAKELLKQAGYIDQDGDGYRENPDGKSFNIKFAHYDSGNPSFESRAKALMKYWEDVGLKVELSMIESSFYYELIEEDEPNIEVFYGGWGMGSDADPLIHWSADSVWNYPRWVNPKAEKLLKDAVNPEIVGTNLERRKRLYVEWQKIFNEEVPVLPIAEIEGVMAVAKRVKGVEFNVAGPNSSHEWRID